MIYSDFSRFCFTSVGLFCFLAFFSDFQIFVVWLHLAGVEFLQLLVATIEYIECIRINGANWCALLIGSVAAFGPFAAGDANHASIPCLMFQECPQTNLHEIKR